MFGKLWNRIVNVPTLLLAIEVLRRDAREQAKGQDVRAAWERFKRDPAIAPLAPRFSAEWRAIEEALKRMG